MVIDFSVEANTKEIVIILRCGTRAAAADRETPDANLLGAKVQHTL